MKKEKLSINFIFQFLYQVVILVIPLLVSPYLTRVLGDNALGTYTYVNSIAYYFLLLANLGISKYGQRAIAQYSNDSVKLRKSFWSLFLSHLVSSFISIVIYLFLCFLFVKKNQSLFLIQMIYVLSAAFDITWLFTGLENFKSVVIKNTIIKILECIFVFLFIKSEKDIFAFALIMSISSFVSSAILFPQAFKIVRPIKVTVKDCLSHTIPLLVFSISVISVTLYTVFDKTLLGLLSSNENVAYYEYANRIISVPKTFIVVIGSVMFPRACKMVVEGNKEKQEYYSKISLLVVSFIGMASLFGLLAISDEFAVYYYGEDFAISGIVMKAMCGLPLIIGIGDIVRLQWMIPNKMDKQYTLCVILNAIINIIISCLLIPKIGIYGAVIGTLSAELFGCIFQIVLCKGFLSFKLIISTMIPFLLIGGLMYLGIFLVDLFDLSGLLSLLIKIIVGIVIYCTLSLIYLFVFEKELSSTLKRTIINKLKRKK